MAAAEPSASAAAPAADPIQPMAQPQNTAQPFAQYPSAYGQPFQSYHQYQPAVGAAPAGAQQQQQLRPPPVEEKKGWVYTLAGLHAAGAIFSIILIALSFSVPSGSLSRYIAWFTTPIPFIAFVWSVSELVVRYTRKFKSGIHPGAHVALCLIIWLCASIVGGMFTTYSVIRGEDDYDYDDDSNNCTTSSWNSSTEQMDYSNCSSARSHGGFYTQFIALAVFTWFLWIIYFVLFVCACIDTHKRNTAARRPIMIVQPGSYWPQPAQGWQQLPPGSAGGPPPQQQQQQDIPLQNRGASQENNANEKGKQADYYA